MVETSSNSKTSPTEVQKNTLIFTERIFGHHFTNKVIKPFLSLFMMGKSVEGFHTVDHFLPAGR